MDINEKSNNEKIDTFNGKSYEEMYKAFKDKSNKEIFQEFKEIEKAGGKITLEMIDAAVASRSTEDKIAPPGAVTMFYSGESDEFIDKFVDANPQIRALKHTEAYQFIGDKQFTYFLEEARYIDTKL